MNLNSKVMKTQVSNKNGFKKFETLSIEEMAQIAGGNNKYKKVKKDKKVNVSITTSAFGAKEKDVFDPKEN